MPSYCRDCREIHGVSVRAHRRKGKAWLLCTGHWQWFDRLSASLAADAPPASPAVTRHAENPS